MKKILSLNTQKYLSTYQEIFDHMMAEMTDAYNKNWHDNISLCFINTMIPHHAAAIEMCKNLLLYTTNLYLQDMAQHIITLQSQGIEDMLSLQIPCSTYNYSPKDYALYRQRYESIANTMFTEMKTAPEVNSIDCDFVLEMLPHHRGAVSMSANALQYNQCPQLTEILQNIVTTQSKGITQLTYFKHKYCR